MSENIENFVPHLLMKIQEDMAVFRKSMEERLDKSDNRMARSEKKLASIETRFEGIETILRKQRRDSVGMLVMMRATAGDFDERVRDIEERMDAFEKSKN